MRLFSPPSLVVYFLVLSTAVASGYFWLVSAQKPIDNADSQSIVFVVSQGQTSESIAKKLISQNLIKSEIAFKYVLAKEGLSRKLQAGSFRLSKNMSSTEIAHSLTKGSLDTWIKVIEGTRREEMAQDIEKQLRQEKISFDSQIFLDLTQEKEGYLFPDSYLIPVASSEQNIVAILESTLLAKLTQDVRDDILESGRTVNQVVTMASLIEREARTDVSRKIVSGILWNRVDGDWALGVDATLQFIKGYDKQNQTWWPEPLAVDKEIDSPYNTYKYPGLPPAPISSFSESSLMAAIYSTPSDYWFYITDPQGNMRYATTLQEHNDNVQKYLR